MYSSALARFTVDQAAWSLVEGGVVLQNLATGDGFEHLAKGDGLGIHLGGGGRHPRRRFADDGSLIVTDSGGTALLRVPPATGTPEILLDTSAVVAFLEAEEGATGCGSC